MQHCTNIFSDVQMHKELNELSHQPRLSIRESCCPHPAAVVAASILKLPYIVWWINSRRYHALWTVATNQTFVWTKAKEQAITSFPLHHVIKDSISVLQNSYVWLHIFMLYLVLCNAYSICRIWLNGNLDFCVIARPFSSDIFSRFFLLTLQYLTFYILIMYNIHCMYMVVMVLTVRNNYHDIFVENTYCYR